MPKTKKSLKIIGWREWGVIPALKIKRIKMKIDTGARTSSLHAFDIKITKKGGKDIASFKVHPEQDDSKYTVNCKAEVIDYRKVKSSNGMSEKRPVIETEIKVLDEVWPIEITLTNRDEMGFRMLLGRASLKNKFLIDTGKSYYSKTLKPHGEK